MRCFTESTTATVLASGWRWIASTTDRLPFKKLAMRSFSTLSMTLRDLAQLHRRAVAVGNDDPAIVLGLAQRAGGRRA